MSANRPVGQPAGQSKDKDEVLKNILRAGDTIRESMRDVLSAKPAGGQATPTKRTIP